MTDERVDHKFPQQIYDVYLSDIAEWWDGKWIHHLYQKSTISKWGPYRYALHKALTRMEEFAK